MTFPINKGEFVDRWLKTIGEHDDTDREMAEAIVSLANRAYYAGLAEGRKEIAALLAFSTAFKYL